MVTLSGSQLGATGSLESRKTTGPIAAEGKQPAMVIANNLDAYWDDSGVAKPTITDREDARLWQDIPNSGLIITYMELGGFRKKMLSNWKFAEESANVTIEVKTLHSNARLLALLGEVERIIEARMPRMSPFPIVRAISRVQSTTATHGAWFGVIRVECIRDVKQTALASPSTFADDGTELETTFKNAVVAGWNNSNVATPVFVVREQDQELWVDVPNAGALIFYGDASGVRRNMRGTWEYRYDVATLVCEVNSPKSRGHLMRLQEEVERIVETLSYGMGKYNSVRVASRNIKYGQTQEFWRGDIRVEVTQHVRTGYTVGM